MKKKTSSKRLIIFRCDQTLRIARSPKSYICNLH